MSKVGTIIAPELPSKLPNHCQWLSGQGIGAWFCIDKIEKESYYLIKRFSAEGNLDCEGVFEIEYSENQFDILRPYQFTHISHCAKCRIIQDEIMYVFNCI